MCDCVWMSRAMRQMYARMLESGCASSSEGAAGTVKGIPERSGQTLQEALERERMLHEDELTLAYCRHQEEVQRLEHQLRRVSHELALVRAVSFAKGREVVLLQHERRYDRGQEGKDADAGPPPEAGLTVCETPQDTVEDRRMQAATCGEIVGAGISRKKPIRQPVRRMGGSMFGSIFSAG